MSNPNYLDNLTDKHYNYNYNNYNYNSHYNSHYNSQPQSIQHETINEQINKVLFLTCQIEEETFIALAAHLPGSIGLCQELHKIKPYTLKLKHLIKVIDDYSKDKVKPDLAIYIDELKNCNNMGDPESIINKLLQAKKDENQNSFQLAEKCVQKLLMLANNVHAIIVAEKSLRNLALKNSLSYEDIQSEYQKLVMARKIQESTININKKQDGNIHNIINKITTAAKGELGDDFFNRKVVETGYSSLDAKIGGFVAGNISLIAAATGSGKTTFMANIAANAYRNGYKVLYLTTEMPEDEISFKVAGAYLAADKSTKNITPPELLDIAMEQVGKYDEPVIQNQLNQLNQQNTQQQVEELKKRRHQLLTSTTEQSKLLQLGTGLLFESKVKSQMRTDPKLKNHNPKLINANLEVIQIEPCTIDEVIKIIESKCCFETMDKDKNDSVYPAPVKPDLVIIDHPRDLSAELDEKVDYAKFRILAEQLRPMAKESNFAVVMGMQMSDGGIKALDEKIMGGNDIRQIAALIMLLKKTSNDPSFAPGTDSILEITKMRYNLAKNEPTRTDFMFNRLLQGYTEKMPYI